MAPTDCPCQGIQLLERFVQEDRVRIRNPRTNLQIKFTRRLSSGNDFVAYIDAIGELNGKHSIIDWKTSSARYPDEPTGLLALDRSPQPTQQGKSSIDERK
jgi:hypothetical protein